MEQGKCSGIADLAAAWERICRLGNEYFCFYNIEETWSWGVKRVKQSAGDNGASVKVPKSFSEFKITPPCAPGLPAVNLIRIRIVRM